MRTVIVGPGAIGCLFAGLLTRAGQNVALLDKDPARAAHIAERGLLLEGDNGTETFAIEVTADPATVHGPVDCLCICVKAYDTRAAIKHSYSVVSNNTLIVALQNGLGSVA